MISKLTQLFKQPDATQLAERELELARRELLTAQSNKEFYTQMEGYNLARVRRLDALLKGARA